MGRAATLELEATRRAKISVANLGKQISDETRAKQRQIALEQGRKPPYFWQDTTGIHPLLGKHHSEETKAKLRETSRTRVPHPSGSDHPLYGKSPSIETRTKIATSLKGQQCPPNSYAPAARRKIGIKAKKRWASPEFRRRVIPKCLTCQKPNRSEQSLINLFQVHSLPFKYVGNGEFILGGKCPDFINTNGKKQVIELFGRFWHPESDVTERTEHFKQYGFDTLIIWEEELDCPEVLLRKVRYFSEGEPIWEAPEKEEE